ncbi:MAG: AAA family ATPase [Halieaceae bacterium]|nr:AAA family ATPase [Halieaceae bacterium]
MYYQYFGLKEAPFSIAVNPRYLFMSPRHRDALAHLLYGVGAGGGFILLTGEVGTGKTTINRCLLEQLPDNTDIAIILNPALNALELLATVCDELVIDYDRDNLTLKSLTDKLHHFLLVNHVLGRKTVLLIDEAQHLDYDVLEQVRLLTNLETNSEKLLQIILIGQPELAAMLARPELRQLNQRITARYNLEPLNLEETSAYIRHRLQVAGMTAGQEVFPPAVVRGIHRRTRGIPRLINVVCDRMLLGAYGRNQDKTDLSLLRLAAREVMGEEAQAPAPRASARLAWSLAAVLLLAGGAGWWLLERYQWDMDALLSRQPDLAVEPAPTGPPAEPAEVAPAEPEPVVAAGPAKAPPQDDWLLPPLEALTTLWSLYSSAALPLNLCAGEIQEELVCVSGYAGTWDELATFDRPLLLDMISPERFAAATLLLGMDERSAWVATANGPALVELGELGLSWSGSYRLLWHPPAGYSQSLALDDDSAVVARIADLFARLDGQEQALAGTRFTPALQTRVRLFQQEQGLKADGVVGMQTLLRLNERLGISPTAAQARARLETAATVSAP